jgi:serine/threonine protein phosphatase PrpC
MHCPACGTGAPSDNRFCEVCGALLVADSGASSSSAGSIVACTRCGAGPAEIDGEGFCVACGFRCHGRERDHLEVTLAPYLGGVTDRGLSHPDNEDALALAQSHGREAYVLVVCDGVSSSQAADLASQAAADAACRALTETIPHDTGTAEAAMCAAVEAALLSVRALPYTSTVDKDPPSTPLVAAVVCEGHATIGWVGDSRAYWIDRDGVKQLTHDDSWLNEIVAAGHMSIEAARRSGKAHALTRWLGADADESTTASVVQVEVSGAGLLLLCTDGLWNYMPELAQLAILVQEATTNAPDAVTVARRLVTFACARGGRDNVTAAVLSLPAGPLTPGR